MQFCQPHWDTMREEVAKRGLSAYVPDDGHETAYRLERALKQDEDTIDNFDPLMYMHWAIAGNSMDVLSDIGGDPTWLFMDWTQHPEEEVRSDEAFLAAVQCPICILNLASHFHDLHCPDPNCQKEPGQTFDWMIERAGQDAEDKARSFHE